MERLCVSKFTLLLLLYYIHVCFSHAPEKGRWSFKLTQEKQYGAVYKTLYNNTFVSVKLHCTTPGKDVNITVKWIFRYSPCVSEYVETPNNAKSMSEYFNNPDACETSICDKFKEIKRQHNMKKNVILCSNNGKDDFLKPEVDNGYDLISMLKTTTTPKAKKVTTVATTKKIVKPTTAPIAVTTNSKETVKPTTTVNKPHAKKDVKREVEEKKTSDKPTTKVPVITTEKNADKSKVTTTPVPLLGPVNKEDHNHVCESWQDGEYIFVMQATPDAAVGEKFTLEVMINVHGKYGFLSAADWPLLVFYGAMVVVYVLYAVVWLVLSLCNWRDMLRVQFWIGGVIALGLLEKAVYYAEYQSINHTGQSLNGAYLMAEFVSCIKRTVSRILVVIVSLGFGIIKPRLGPVLHKVLAMGVLYFILGVAEACLRVYEPKGDPHNHKLFALIPLTVLDAAIAWWVFSSLVQTMRTLRLRRNVVKLTLYRHFTNTLIFVVLASVVFMIWVTLAHKRPNCVDWHLLWLDDAYWHLLFSLILLVIMVLWRPTINNQRYAFSPLLDAADDENEEPLMNDAYDGMKMRGYKDTTPKSRDSKSKVEEDLKWIDENIPTSVADTALPSLLDSDEEIMTTKYEMSKME